MKLSNIDEKITAYCIISLLIMLFLYTFLHELGHGLIGIFSGGKIDNIILGFDARIYMSNEHYNAFTYPLMNAGGVLLPIIILFFVLLIYNSSVKNYFYHIFYIIFSIGIISSSLAWVVIPVISLFTQPPVGDDVTNFMNHSSIHPLFISVAAITIMGILCFIAQKKGLFKKIIKLQNESKNYRKSKQ